MDLISWSNQLREAYRKLQRILGKDEDSHEDHCRADGSVRGL